MAYDLRGQRFGRLLVLNRHGSDNKKNITWLCQCDCGNQKIIIGTAMLRGETRSCGCLQKEAARKTLQTHGKSKTRLYRVWAGMKSRCLNPNADNYKYYGAIGVTICDEWIDDYETFESWALSSGYDDTAGSQECTLDRIDNTKGYSPDNCRWTNHFIQCNNQSSNKVYSYNGESHTISEWAKISGVKYKTLVARLNNGMDFAMAIQPINLRTQKQF